MLKYEQKKKLASTQFTSIGFYYNNDRKDKAKIRGERRERNSFEYRTSFNEQLNHAKRGIRTTPRSIQLDCAKQLDPLPFKFNRRTCKKLGRKLRFERPPFPLNVKLPARNEVFHQSFRAREIFRQPGNYGAMSIADVRARFLEKNNKFSVVLTTIISEGSRTKHSLGLLALPPVRLPKLQQKITWFKIHSRRNLEKPFFFFFLDKKQ